MLPPLAFPCCGPSRPGRPTRCRRGRFLFLLDETDVLLVGDGHHHVLEAACDVHDPSAPVRYGHSGRELVAGARLADQGHDLGAGQAAARRPDGPQRPRRLLGRLAPRRVQSRRRVQPASRPGTDGKELAGCGQESNMLPAASDLDDWVAATAKTAPQRHAELDVFRLLRVVGAQGAPLHGPLLRAQLLQDHRVYPALHLGRQHPAHQRSHLHEGLSLGRRPVASPNEDRRWPDQRGYAVLPQLRGRREETLRVGLLLLGEDEIRQALASRRRDASSVTL